MRPLSPSQAATCETAKHPKCKCRCKGAYHGAVRVTFADERREAEIREKFSALPETDPHYVPQRPSSERRREKRIREFHARHHYKFGHAAMPGPRAVLIKHRDGVLRRCRVCIEAGREVPTEPAHVDEERGGIVRVPQGEEPK
jgi:hypothetical protein